MRPPSKAAERRPAQRRNAPPPRAPSTPALDCAAGAEVDAALVGTLLRAGDQLRVASQLVEVPSSTVVRSHTAQVPVGDLFGLQDELTRKIVDSLSLPLTARERRMLKQDVPASPQVYETYLRANEMARQTAQWRAALDLYRALHRRRSPLRASVGRPRPHAPDTGEVRGRGNGIPAS